MTAPSPTTTGRLMADEDVHDAVLRLLALDTATARSQAATGVPVPADDAEHLAAYQSRLTQLRDRLAGAINAGRGGV